MSGVATWDSPITGDSGPHVGLLDRVNLAFLVLSQNHGLRSPPGPHLDLVNLVPIWASPSPGDFVPHLDLIAVDSRVPGNSGPHLASSGPSDSGPYLGFTWI